MAPNISLDTNINVTRQQSNVRLTIVYTHTQSVFGVQVMRDILMRAELRRKWKNELRLWNPQPPPLTLPPPPPPPALPDFRISCTRFSPPSRRLRSADKRTSPLSTPGCPLVQTREWCCCEENNISDHLVLNESKCIFNCKADFDICLLRLTKV